MSNEDRDKRFRRNALTALSLAFSNAPRKGLSGDTLLDHANAPLAFDQKIERETDASVLFGELELSGYITAEIVEPRRRGELLKLSHQLFKITDKGVRLLKELIPADPMVWDERACD